MNINQVLSLIIFFTFGLNLVIPVLTKQHPVSANPSSWWDMSWSYSRQCWVDTTNVDADLVNFPVLVRIPDATGDLCKSAGEDIRFVSNGNTTVYPYDIEKWVDGSDRLVWVRIPRVDDAVNTSFWMYYGNNGASALTNYSQVWTNYNYVLHMNGTTNINDFTSNNHDGTSTADASSDGIVGDCQLFTAANIDKITMGDHDDFTYSDGSDDIAFTVSMWCKPTIVGAGPDQIFLFAKDAVNNREYRLSYYWSGATKYLEAYIFDVSLAKYHQIIANVALSQTSYQLITLTYNGNEKANGLDIFVNNTKLARTCSNASSYVCMENKAQALEIGDYGYTDVDTYNGLMDEVRAMRGTCANASWVKAEYYSVQQSDFIEIGYQRVKPGNNNPINSNIQPSTGSTGVHRNQKINVTVTDPNGDDMNVSFRTNKSGAWQTVQTNTSVGDGTYRYQTTDLTVNNKRYWFNISTNDGMGGWDNDTIYFTIEKVDYNTSVNTISPYSVTSSPKTITVTGNNTLTNVTLYYRNSTNNATWGFEYYDGGLWWEDADMHYNNDGEFTASIDYINTAVVKNANHLIGSMGYSPSNTIFAYMAVYTSNCLTIANVTNQWDVQNVTKFSTGLSGQPHDILIHDYPTGERIAFILEYNGDLNSIDVTNVSNILIKDTDTATITETRGFYMDLDENNMFLYVTATDNTNGGNDALYVFNVTDFNDMVYICKITIPNDQLWDVQVDDNNDNYVYVSCNDGPGGAPYSGKVYSINTTWAKNVSSPSMKLQNTSKGVGTFCILHQNGNYLYALSQHLNDGTTGAGEFVIWDISNPENLTNVSRTDIDSYHHFCIWTEGPSGYDYAFTQEVYDIPGIDEGFYAVNISDPNAVSRIFYVPHNAVTRKLQSTHWMQLHYNNITDEYVLYAIGYQDDSWVTFNITMNGTFNDGWIGYNIDSVYPWSFDFNFPNGTGYYEFYSIGVKAGNGTEDTPASKDAMCHYAGVSRNWEQVVSGWFNFDNTATMKTVESGYFLFNNDASFKQQSSGWFSFNNVASFRQVVSGYVNFENTAGFRQQCSGWFIFSGVPSTWKNITTGYFNFANTASFKQISSGYACFSNSASYKQIMSGYANFGNIASYRPVSTGYFLFSNVSMWDDIQSGYFLLENTASFKAQETGYFLFGNIALFKQQSSGYFVFSNISSFKQISTGWFIFNSPEASFKQIVSGYFLFENIGSHKQIQSGYFSFSNVALFKQIQSGYFSFGNMASFKQEVAGYFNFNNIALFKQQESGWFILRNTADQKQITSGWFEFGNISVQDWGQVSSGWFNFSNISSFKGIASGYFLFQNIQGWSQIKSGHFNFGNTANQKQVSSGWFMFSNTAADKQILSGYFRFENGAWRDINSGWFRFENISIVSWKIQESGWFEFQNISYITIESGYFVFSNISISDWKNVSSCYLIFANNALHKQLLSGWFIFSNIVPYIPPEGGGPSGPIFGSLNITLKNGYANIKIYKGATLMYTRNNLPENQLYQQKYLLPGVYTIIAEDLLTGKEICRRNVTIEIGKTTNTVVDLKEGEIPPSLILLSIAAVSLLILAAYLINKRRKTGGYKVRIINQKRRMRR